MQEPYRKGSSESILTSSLARDIARCFLKRRQRHRWAGLLSCEKPVDQEADSIPSRRKATRQPRKSGVAVSVLRSLRTRRTREGNFRGGWGGKGADEGEHRSTAHAPDTEREVHVPGVGRCAEGSKGKKAGAVHRIAPPP